MELKTWLTFIKILNFICSGMLIGFQIWFIVDLIEQHRTLYGFFIRIWAPIFIILIALIIVLTELQYEKMVQYFKFLQWLPGIGFFNLFIASILAFQFSIINDTVSIILASIFAFMSLLFFLLHFIRPTGSRGLLLSEEF